jgi:hypothetical protein
MIPPRFGPIVTRKHASKLFLAGALSLLSACGPSEEGQTFTAETEAELEQVMPMLRPGDVLKHGDLSLRVPPEGQGLYMEALYVDGRKAELSVRTGTDGKVALVRGTPSLEAADYRGALSACNEGAYTLAGHKWRETYQWYFNAGSTPAELNVGATEDKLRAAASNVTGGQNDCGLTDAISASHNYQGRTTRGVSCGGSPDGVNVVGFGDLAQGTLAVTCSWYNPNTNTSTESDIRINKADYTWTLHSEDPDCRGRYGVEAVATHEFGHVFGLGHVSEAAHPALTMSTNIGPCDGSASTLGLGDVRGMRAMY